MTVASFTVKAFEALRTRGLRGAAQLFSRRVDQFRERRRYQSWVRSNTLTDLMRSEIRQAISKLESKPLISIILPVFNVDERWLRRCLDSVLGQLYPNWELCIADDHSTAAHIRPILNEFAQKDGRIKVMFRDANGHISAASNSALGLATGDFAVLLDHDDELSEDALYWVANEVAHFPDVMMIYSDEDKIDERGKRSQPAFKPDWSPDLFNSLNLVTHLSAYKTSLLREIGGFRTGFEGSQDYDLALRVIEKISENEIRHIPRILYHWRAIPGSVAQSGGEKPYAHERARIAIREHLARCGVRAQVEASKYDLHRVRYDLPDRQVTVSVGLLGAQTDSMTAAKTTYEHAEFHRFKGHTFQAGEIDQWLKSSNAEVICLLAADLAPLCDRWLEELISFAVQPGIGVVGGKIVDSSMKVVDGPIVVGTQNLCDVAHKGLSSEVPGNVFRNEVISNFSAVSVSCMAYRRNVALEVGGFDAENLSNSLFDIDLCLRVREKGYRIVHDPFVAMLRPAAAERRTPPEAETEYFRKRWKHYFRNDPYYNPNFSYKDGMFTIKV
jgi:GT2 family glycosyltransferase